MTHTISREQIEALSVLADNATSGPWGADKHETWAFPQTQVHRLTDGRQIVRFLKGEPQFWCTIGKAEREWANANFVACASPDVIRQLCTGYLERLDMEPRPLSEIKEDAAIIIDEADGSRGIVVYRYHFGWATNVTGHPWSEDHLAIPLSSLPKVTP